MKINFLLLSFLIVVQFFFIEKNHAASSLTATTPLSISAKTDSLEEMEDLFYDYTRDESEEKRLTRMANATILLISTAFLSLLLAGSGIVTLGVLGFLAVIGSTVLGIITFIKARDYRRRLKYLDTDDPLYESHKKISKLSKAAFVIALIPFSLIFLSLLLAIALFDESDAASPIFFGAIGILTFLGLERFVFRTNDIK